jgi:hypothetical protein
MSEDCGQENDGRITLLTCPECGNVASIEWECWICNVPHVKLRCVNRHWFLMSAERITYYGTEVLYRPTPPIHLALSRKLF